MFGDEPFPLLWLLSLIFGLLNFFGGAQSVLSIF